MGRKRLKERRFKKTHFFRSKIMTTITYRGKHYDKEAYKAAVLAEQTATRNHNLMYRGIKIERKFASQS
jgi:hypothetical protein